MSRNALTSRTFSRRDMQLRHVISRYIWKSYTTGYYSALPGATQYYRQGNLLAILESLAFSGIPTTTL
eukprot:196157-Amorphochlora_amoeboformis.AAC.1